MIARLALVMSYFLVLALTASITIALPTGASLSALMMAWLGPMLVLASASFALTLLVGSVFALIGTCVLAAWQLVQVHLAGSFGVTVALHLRQLNPITLALLIAVLLAVGVVAATVLTQVPAMELPLTVPRSEAIDRTRWEWAGFTPYPAV